MNDYRDEQILAKLGQIAGLLQDQNEILRQIRDEAPTTPQGYHQGVLGNVQVAGVATDAQEDDYIQRRQAELREQQKRDMQDYG